MQLSEYKDSMKTFTVQRFVKIIRTGVHSIIKIQAKAKKREYKNTDSFLSKHEEQMLRNKVMVDYEQIRAGLINRY